jgi:cobalt-zinc-cadmium efflux system protein
MATDAAALALALFARWLAGRPATPGRSFGYLRAEVLAAFVNASALVVVSCFILWEAVRRAGEPPEVDSLPMLLVAIAGLLANAGAAWVLWRGGGHGDDLNVRGALLHVLGDLLGSFGAIVAALVMLATGWYLADPLLSAGIGLLILWSAWRLMREAVDVLLEAAPAALDVPAVRCAIGGVPGVAGVHDLHVWTVTSGLVALSGHVEVTRERPWSEVLVELATLLRERFAINHVTLQPEDAAALPDSFRGCSLDSPEGRSACLAPPPAIGQDRVSAGDRR